MKVSLSRFNAALLRERKEDRVIDLSICLESLFSNSTEISFRFSLYNSLISSDDTAKRLGNFAVLKEMYKDRSKLVHGEYSASKLSDDDLRTLINVAKSAITYKLEYVRRNGNSKGWQDHLDKLALGAAKFILEGD